MLRFSACLSVAVLLWVAVAGVVTSSPRGHSLPPAELDGLVGGTGTTGCWMYCAPCQGWTSCSHTGTCGVPFGDCYGITTSHEGSLSEECQFDMWNETCSDPPPDTTAHCWTKNYCECDEVEGSPACVNDKTKSTTHYYAMMMTDHTNCNTIAPLSGSTGIPCGGD